MTYQSIPKVELHLHLEGAAPPDFIKRLAQEKGIDLGNLFTEDGGYSYDDFQGFIDAYDASCAPIRSPEDYARLTTAVAHTLANHNVVYAETFISPYYCGGHDLSAWREYLDAITGAAEAAERDLGVTLRGIITCIRHLGPDPAKRDARCAAETRGGFIRGFGIAGAEMMGEPKDFAYSFDMAREADLHLTAHAGEWGGPKMVRDTLADLDVSRIGHGINAIHDSDLIELLVEQNITLEICPGSNVALGAVAGWCEHPVQKLREAGVNVTISTDDPPFFHTTMTHEYDMLNKTFGWDSDDFYAINQTALKAAYCDDETRARIAKKLETA